jgi:hypothetical protein
MGTALALRGRQGVGKTIVGKIVGSLLGAATRRSRLWARRPGRPASHQAEAAKRGQQSLCLEGWVLMMAEAAERALPDRVGGAIADRFIDLQ